MIQVMLDQIVVPENRFRKEFDEKKLAELEASISRIGLLNPITVEKSEDIENVWILRAGERRFKVLSKILRSGGSFQFGTGTFTGEVVPVVDFATLSEQQRLEIEVEENVVRADFTWQERTKALAALHNLRKLQNPTQTVAATATEVLGKTAVGSQRMVVADALIVAQHLDDPDVAKAKDEKSAIKIIQKKAEIAHRARLSVNFNPRDVAHTLIKDDSQHALAKMQDGSFDVIITDPPYGVGADGFGTMSGTGHNYADDREQFEGILSWLPDTLARVSKPSAACYIFCDIRHFEKLHTFMVLAGWTAFNTPLIWDKCGTGMLPFPENGPRRTYETIFFAWKGNRRANAIKSDVIRIPAVKSLAHGAQKPVALYQDLILRSASPGDTVLDCFGGSGTILVAANNTKTVATYIELNADSYAIATQRSTVTGYDDGSEEDDGIEISL